MSQEEVAVPFYDFMYSKYLLKDLYDIDMQPDDYVERAYNVFRAIGNIATAIYSFKFTIDSTGCIDLPCNVEFIEAVSTGQDNLSESTGLTMLYSNENISPNGFMADIILDKANKISVPQTSILHATGNFIPYQLMGKPGHYKLKFGAEYVNSQCVCIYRGILVDCDDNPLLFRKEAEAIAAQLAFLDTQKKVFMRDPNAMPVLAYIKAEANRMMAAAKVPEYITQNQWNRVFSALTSHNRKVYHSSYKSLQ